MTKKSTPPPVPDYAAAATAQGAANVEAARATAKLGNPNIYGPLGSQTISYGANKIVDQAGFDKAMAAYNQSTVIDQAGYDKAMAAYNRGNKLTRGNAPNIANFKSAAKGAAPDIAKFTTQDFDIPTITQTLTPDAQATLNAQQGVERSLAELGQQGVGQAKTILGTPFDPKLPGIQTSIGATPANQTAYTAGNAQSSVAGPNFQQGIDTPISVNQDAYTAGNAQRSVTGPNLRQGIDTPISVNQDAYTAGNAQGSVGGPTFQQRIDTSGIAKMPVNAGMTGQQAIMSRLQPQLTQNENATRQRLANQGLVSGGEAYNNEMRTMGQNRNDLELQAAAQGINLDAMMNQQGFGQAQAQGQFGNEAQTSQFNAALANAGLGNSAINQNFSNQLAGQTAQNAAIAQNYNQQLGMAQFGNEAQLNQFQSALQNAGMGNTALQQDYQNQLASQTAQNAAIAQNYNQRLGQAQFGNEAQLAQFNAGLQNAALANSALQQNFGNQLSGQSAQNAAIAQNYNQQLGQAQFGNTAQDQSLAQQLAIRNQPLNQITGLMSGSQIQMPQFQGYQGANIAAAPVYQGVQDTFQGQMDQYGLKQQSKNAGMGGMMSTVGSLGGAGMMAF